MKKFDYPLLIEHRDNMKTLIPYKLKFGLNILAYYSMINELDLYFRSFQIIFERILEGIQEKEFMDEVYTWIGLNCPLRDIYTWKEGVDYDLELANGDVIFYIQQGGYLDQDILTIIITDVEKQVGIDWMCNGEVSYKDFKKIAVVSPREVKYHQVSDVDMSSFDDWKIEFKDKYYGDA